MAANHTESLGANSSSSTRSVFYCPNSPDFIWDLNHTTSLKIVLAVSTIACLVITLLNLLVIIAMKKRRDLKKNSNILISRLAVTDLLVGAVSLPLTITVDALILQRTSFEDIACTINTMSVLVLYILSCVSFLHLILIAWERFVAIAKWMKYKIIVTRERLTKYVRVAWLSSLIALVPASMLFTGVRYELILIADVILTILWVGCFLFLIYCYVKVYLEVRKQNRRAPIRSVNAQNRRKMERKIAYTSFWITAIVCMTGLPTFFVALFGGVIPSLRESSIFRWAETIFQLNSLFNSLLYCYRDRHLRKAALELLRRRKPTCAEVGAMRRARRRRYSVASLDVEGLQISQSCPRLMRIEPTGSVLFSDAARPASPDNTAKESALSKIENDKVFTQPLSCEYGRLSSHLVRGSSKHQCNRQDVTVQIENVPRKKHTQLNSELSKDTLELKRSHYHTARKIMRSTSLNGNSIISLSNCHLKKKDVRRSNSVPISSTVGKNTQEHKLTVSQLTSEKDPAWKSYEETKL